MQYAFTLTGTMPILMHADDVEAADRLSEWRKSPRNKGTSVAGDDRSPPWTWQSYLYHDGTNLAVPHANIMRCLCGAAARIPKRQGRGTLKSVSQSGLYIQGEFCDFRGPNGKPVPIAPIVGMSGLTFAEQATKVRDLGFELKVKRAAVGKAKHVRVRAMFRAWSILGTIQILDPVITGEILAEMFSEGGRTIGLLDWRPSAPKGPGPYGVFDSSLKPLAG